MSNPNPLSPQGSLLERQAANKSSLRVAALIVLAHVCVLGGFLILGCKKDEKPKDVASDAGSLSGLSSPIDTNPPPVTDGFASNTNPPPAFPPVANPVTTPPVSNVSVAPAPFVAPAPAPTAPPVAETAPAPGGAGDYKVKPGDFPQKIAKAHGITVKALMAANPGLKANKLKVNQTIHIPEGGKPADAGAATANPAPGTPPTAAPESATPMTGSYKVKGGDTLTHIAKKHGTTVKALRAANGLKDNNIKAGQVLKVPGGSAAAETPAPAPTAPPSAAPGLVPPSSNGAPAPR